MRGMQPLSRFIVQIKDGTHGSHERIDNGIPLLSAKNVSNNGVRVRAGESLISHEEAAAITANGFPAKNDVLLTTVGTIGRSTVWERDEPMPFQRSVSFIRFNKEQNPKFFKYYFESRYFQDQLQLLAKTSAQPGIYMGDVKRIPAPTIDKGEQNAIVAQLEDKLAIIDKILSIKNHTHTQLQELRTAIITSVVLGRGGAAMSLRQTNIPWIGSIPAHWQVEKVKGVADIVLGKMLQSTEKEGYAFKKYLRAQNIRWESVDVSDVNEMWFSPKELSTYRLQKDDILVSEGGEVGRAAIWKDELDECYIQNSVNRLRVDRKKILPEYLLYVLESYGQAKVFEGTVNRVSIAHLTREKLKEYYIPLPPLDEQRQIVKVIHSRLHKIDTTSSELERSIAYLDEYRSSLISNVVGGKVKV